MRHQPVEGGTLKVIRFQRFINDVCKLSHRHLEHLVPCHGQVNRIVRINAIGVRQGQQFAVAAISMQMRRDDTRLFGLPQQYRARTITKNNDRSAIG